jgi:hypothetical protein
VNDDIEELLDLGLELELLRCGGGHGFERVRKMKNRHCSVLLEKSSERMQKLVRCRTKAQSPATAGGVISSLGFAMRLAVLLHARR